MASFSIEDLTGAQYDEVELIVGQSIESDDVPKIKLVRAVGYVRTKEREPGLTHAEYNRRSVAQQIADSGLSDEDPTEGKDASS